MSFRRLPIAEEAQVLAHIHPSQRWFACGTRPFLLGVHARHSVRGRPRTAKCPGPLRPHGALLHASRRSRRVGGRYPTLFATTGPCARPHPSRRLRPTVSVSGSSQVAASPCWEVALPDVISAGPSLDARPHAAAGRRGAHARYFPRRHRPSLRDNRSAFPRESAQRLQSGKDFAAAGIPLCSGLQVCLPPRSLPPLRPCRRAAMAFSSEQNVRRYLRTHRICLPSEPGN